MIAWLNPAALSGLALLAGPILVHVLLRHRAKRVPFPSLRFVHVSRTAAARFRLPSDLLLLLLRLGIVALAVAAAAQPIVITRSRLAAWNARTARAIVVDVSDSMIAGASQQAGVPGAAEVAKGESQDVAFAARIDAADLKAGLRQAAAWLAAVPPARREIVVVSDFQRGALMQGDLDVVPPGIGVRLVQVGATESDRQIRGLQLFGAGDAGRQEILLSRDSTAVIVAPEQPAIEGLRLLSAVGDNGALLRALERAVASAGTPAPSLQQPITIAFAGAPRVDGVHAISETWMLATVLRLENDRDMAGACDAEITASRAAATGRGTSGSGAAPASRIPDPADRDVAEWYGLCRGGVGGRSLVRAAAAGADLVVDVAAPPSAFLSAAVVRGVLIARQGPSARPEDEIQRMTAAELTAWSRQIAPVPPDAWQSQTSDSRWCWALVLALLAVETGLRRRAAGADRGTASEVGADAA